MKVGLLSEVFMKNVSSLIGSMAILGTFFGVKLRSEKLVGMCSEESEPPFGTKPRVGGLVVWWATSLSGLRYERGS